MKTERYPAKYFIAMLVLSLMAPLFVSAYEAAPLATTMDVTFITEKSARLNGRVNGNGTPDTYQWFEWGVVGRPEVVYETPHVKESGSKQVTTTANLVGLAPHMQYFFRQVAENSRGRDVGLTSYFTTKVLPNIVVPITIVQTKTADSIAEDSAVLNGYVSPHGNSAAKWWFQWGVTTQLENETPHSAKGKDSGPVKTTIKGLSSGTPYYFRVVGENADGRTYGATQVFVTLGTALPTSAAEQPRAQTVPVMQSASDGVSRTVTTNGAAKSTTQTQNRPGDIFGFGALFGGKQNNSGGSATTSASGSANTQVVAGAAAAGPLGGFWNALTGKKGVEVTIEKIGPKSVPAHTPIEYRITYAYRLADPAENANLKIVLPGDVVYIGDNTTNELLLEDGAGPERTYVLPVGRLENGSTRTVSILGITTGNADGFPDARARIEFTDQSGAVQVVAAGNASAQSTSSGTSAGGLLPTSLFGWLLYIGVIVGVIYGVRKLKAYYAARKEEIASREESMRRGGSAATTAENNGAVTA